MKFHHPYIDEKTGQFIDIVTERHIECKEGQDEMCAVCKHPEYPECMNRCIPYNKKHAK